MRKELSSVASCTGLIFGGALLGCKPRGSETWQRRALVSKAAMDDGKPWRNGENEKKDGVFHAQNNAGRRGPQVRKGKRTGGS